MTCHVGTDVSSSPFVGEISDLMASSLKESFDNHYELYNSLGKGQRSEYIFDDLYIKERVNYDYDRSHFPKRLLEKYKYGEDYKQTLAMTRTLQSEYQPEGEEDEEADLMHKLCLELRSIKKENPSFFRKLDKLVLSRAFIYRSCYLFSPVIENKKTSENKRSAETKKTSKLDFYCLNYDLVNQVPNKNYDPKSKSKTKSNPLLVRPAIPDQSFPLYPIEWRHMQFILKQVASLSPEETNQLLDLAMFVNSVEYDQIYGYYVIYDRFLHFLCTNEILSKEAPEDEQNNEEEDDQNQSQLLEGSNLGEGEEEEEVKDPEELDNEFYVGQEGLYQAVEEEYGNYMMDIGADEEDTMLYSILADYDDSNITKLRSIYLIRNSNFHIIY